MQIAIVCFVLACALALSGATTAWGQQDLSAADRAEIRSLSARYLQALGECRGEDYADLFVPATGYFASGFRGRMVGHDDLVALVASERHCAAGAAQTRRPGGSAPDVELEFRADGVRGVADLGTAEYQDIYRKTPAGWRFASRTVVLATEKDAGLGAADLLAIQQLAGPGLGNHYVADAAGTPQLMNSGVAVTVTDGVVAGRAWLADGGYRDEVYARDAGGVWRVQSSTYVSPEKN